MNHQCKLLRVSNDPVTMVLFYHHNSGDIDSVEQGNPLYEERELRMDMFELSDDETEGKSDQILK